ncbi:MAG: hypothetical protein HOP29_18570 [Phycisphaerales bacterium]|nr:hypothetical protein [Phycisphaerales bacterium]
MTNIRQSTLRYRQWMPALLMVLAGCEAGQWGRPLRPRTAPGESPASVPAGAPVEPQSSAAAADADPMEAVRSEEARAQVLDFINRLDAIAKTDSPDGAGTESESRGSALRAVESAARKTPANPADPASAAVRHSSGSRPAGTKATVTDPTRAAEKPVEAASFVPDDGLPGLKVVSGRKGGNGPASPPRIIRLAVDRVEIPTPDARSFDEARVANRPLADDTTFAETMVDGLAARVIQSPTDADARWRLALLGLASNRVDDAVFQGAAESTAGLLRSIVAFLSDVRGVLADPVADAKPAMASVETLRDALRERSDPSIPTVALCSRVQAFGVYDELPGGVFQALRPNQAIVYFEVAHFRSEATDDGRFRTVLNERFEVLTPGGESVWTHDVPRIEDVSRRRREDFFVAQRITLPATMTDGKYVLKITVQDQLSQKQTQAIHEFAVGAEAGAN